MTDRTDGRVVTPPDHQKVGGPGIGAPREFADLGHPDEDSGCRPGRSSCPTELGIPLSTWVLVDTVRGIASSGSMSAGPICFVYVVLNSRVSQHVWSAANMKLLKSSIIGARGRTRFNPSTDGRGSVMW
jgi:hypothetical protein